MRHLLLVTACMSCLSLSAMAEPSASAPRDAKKSEYSKEEWQALSPEQKKSHMEARREARKAEREAWKKEFEAASPEEKERMKAELKAKHDANKAKWKERYDKASPEEKKKMEERVEKRREARKEKAQKNTPSN